MRITNKIIQNNNLSNINTNKIYQDTLANQMSTQKKISRPSDDPVVAIRALRLRSSVTEVSQYYDKNIPDASSWLSVTEGALKNLSAIITSMITNCTKGANGDLTSTDRTIILEQMNALSDEIYTTGDVDYAGRYVFTGYRTDTSLCFPAETDKNYTIIEQISSEDLDSVTSVNCGDVLKLNSVNYNTAALAGITEQDISAVNVHRIRLAYENTSDATGNNVHIQSLDGSANWSISGGQITLKHSYEDPYAICAADPDSIIYVPETGEILLGDNRYDTLKQVSDDVTTVEDESEIRITYEKDKFMSGDIRPEHYFACRADGVDYNMGYLGRTKEVQEITYDVGFNQKIRVNTIADECFKPGISRTTDDLVNSLKNWEALEEIQTTLKELITNATGADLETLTSQLDATEKAIVLAKDKTQKMFEKAITTFQGYLSDTSLAITDCGTRSSKLDLINNRMQEQKTTFETLKSENEDVDISRIAIDLNSAELTYEAALMATGKVTQATLLNYI